MKRSWEQQAGPSHAGKAPPQQPGFQQAESRKNLTSQLAGLRHRAAVRANRPPAAAPDDAECEQEQKQQGEEVQMRQQEQQGEAAPVEQDPDMGVCDGHYATLLNHAVPFPYGSRKGSGTSQQQQQQEEQQQQQQDAPQMHAVPDAPDSATDADAFFAAEQQQQEEPRGARRRFVPGSNSREAVSSQLSGLRRKAAFKSDAAQYA